MAGAPRDRVIIDLRGIGDAVRSVAAQRRVTVAHLARQALLATVDAIEPAVAPPGSDGPTPDHSTAKLTLRLPQPHAEALIVNAVGLGLSYGEYVAGLDNRTPLPQPAAEHAADRAALLKSSDQLAALSTDLNAFVQLLRRGSSNELEKYRHRIETMDADIRGHLDLASKFMAHPHVHLRPGGSRRGASEEQLDEPGDRRCGTAPGRAVRQSHHSANASASTAMSVDNDNAPILRSLIASAFRHRTFGPVRASTKHKSPCRWPCIRGLRGQRG